MSRPWDAFRRVFGKRVDSCQQIGEDASSEPKTCPRVLPTTSWDAFVYRCPFGEVFTDMHEYHVHMDKHHHGEFIDSIPAPCGKKSLYQGAIPVQELENWRSGKWWIGGTTGEEEDRGAWTK